MVESGIKSQPLNNEKGMALVLVLLIMSVMVLLGSTATMEATTNLRISGNYKLNAQAFYAAESGIETGRARLRATSANPITDSNPTNYQWTSDFTSGTTPSYAVQIRHRVNASNQVLYWGDTNSDGRNERNTTTGTSIYLVTSTGSAVSGSKRIVAEMARMPPFNPPAALYVEAATSILGTSTHIFGSDPPSCGTGSLPGIATTLAPGTVTNSGNPKVCGSTATGCTAGTWSVTGGATDMDVDEMIRGLRGSANYSYSYNVNRTESGMNWGVPVAGATQDDPSTCSASNIVYYNMNGLEIRLTGGSSGCGILIVDGNLELNGGFNWHGIILVSGSVTIAGGGDKNITGSVVAGGSTSADLVGGNTSIVYCSAAINNQTLNHSLRTLSWLEE